MNIGTRQSGRERGRNVIDVSYDRDEIAAALRVHNHNGRPASDPLYGDGQAGPRIASQLAESELTIEKRLTY